ncbi:pyridoxamine 5'-phosphate oxidase family protein [Geodermatophilus sabuli]|uniref:Pyridoxamine 5'-phosphate oxidase family protein n=1 Tax=Geodermatophilus sabuli TaxID=1564158 RepID=A0A7K3VUC4_9ACTN|nr:pyridoxamine 5'-phosphate oxidase family protein [Geodermatophilus sabuli]
MLPTEQGRSVVVLGADDCHELLGTVGIGRLGYTRDALPAIAPVPFRLHGDQVIIPSRPGSHLVDGTRGAVVAFEADSFDADVHSGWTVTVIGPSRSVIDADEVATLDALPWPHRPSCPDRRYISVAIGLIRGWRAVPEEPVARPVS